MREQTLALIILNWNGKYLLKRFLPSVVCYTPATVEIIVADNGSTDGSAEFVSANFPHIRIIRLEKNYGFAGGYNKALAEVKADYYILLNSDVEVTKDWINPCISLLEQHKDVAAVQPKIRSLSQPDYFEYAGAAGGYIDYLGYPFCRGRILSTLEKDTEQYNDLVEIFWASGAAFFIRASHFQRAGGFDARFFAHMEEVDLCWRLQNMGYRILSCPKSLVYHMGGASMDASSPQKTYLNFRNNLWMLAKNLNTRNFVKTMAARIMLDAIAACTFLLKGKCRDSLAVIRAHLYLLTHYSRMRQNHMPPAPELPNTVFRKSIVVQYYLRGKKYFSDLRFKASTASK
ncbi:MAG: glycosyltransferase family 2 protein [Bacteroidia bacterium]|nr:MAG: glycosyltransferase family 2 protein [Bacteroidia bacterium]